MDEDTICIPTFVSPHYFWIIAVGCVDVCAVLAKIDQVCEEDIVLEHPYKGWRTGDYVYFYQNESFFRGIIYEICPSFSADPTTYRCWLMDYGKLKVTEVVYDMPDCLRKLPPLAKQASLMDFVYCEHHLELNDSGKYEMKKFPSLTYTDGATVAALEYLREAEQIQFCITYEINDVLYGDLYVTNGGNEKVSLTNYLEGRGLIMKDTDLFSMIQSEIDMCKESFLVTIYKVEEEHPGLENHDIIGLRYLYKHPERQQNNKQILSNDEDNYDELDTKLTSIELKEEKTQSEPSCKETKEKEPQPKLSNKEVKCKQPQPKLSGKEGKEEELQAKLNSKETKDKELQPKLRGKEAKEKESRSKLSSKEGKEKESQPKLRGKEEEEKESHSKSGSKKSVGKESRPKLSSKEGKEKESQPKLRGKEEEEKESQSKSGSKKGMVKESRPKLSSKEGKEKESQPKLRGKEEKKKESKSKSGSKEGKEKESQPKLRGKEEEEKESQSKSGSKKGIGKESRPKLSSNEVKDKQSEMKDTKSSEGRENENLTLTNQEVLPNTKPLRPSVFFSPMVYWSQTEHTVNIRIDFILTDKSNYQVSVVKNKIFTFSSDQMGAEPHKLVLLLYSTVNSILLHRIFNKNVCVTFLKLEKDEHWPRLVFTTQNLGHIRYDSSVTYIPSTRTV